MSSGAGRLPASMNCISCLSSSPPAPSSPPPPYDASSTAYVEVTGPASADVSGFTTAVQDDLHAEVGTDCSVPADHVVGTYEAGSTVMVIKIYEKSGTVSTDDINDAVTANFGGASAFAAYIQTATGFDPGTITEYSVTIVTIGGATKKSSGILFGQGIAVVAGAAASIAVVLLAVIVAVTFMAKRKHGKVASGGGPDASYTSGASEGKPAKGPMEPPERTDVDCVTSYCITV